MERATFALLLAYDGGPYRGWQPQAGLPTVADVLQGALRRAGIGATPFGASRTDAGVHARAQVVSFTTRTGLDPGGLRDRLNCDLPGSIRVLAARAVPRRFHSHWSSVGKIYRYRVSLSGEPRAFRLPAAERDAMLSGPAAIDRALDLLASAPDLGALCSRDDGRVRTLRRASVVARSVAGLTFELAASGYGKHQVRHLVTTALGVASGALSEAQLRAILAGLAPRPPRAPAEGLVLHRVLYPVGLDPFPDLDSLSCSFSLL